MTAYKITATLTADEVVALFALTTSKFKIEEVEAKNAPDLDTVASTMTKKTKATRKLRGSKVETAIRGVLSEGPKTRLELIRALEDAGLKGGSLAATVTKLQTSGEVERSIDGSYSFAKAAE